MKNLLKRMSVILVSFTCAVCIALLGLHLLDKEKRTVSAAAATTTVKLTADKTTLLPGDTFTLTTTISSTRSKLGWLTVALTVSALKDASNVDQAISGKLSVEDSKISLGAPLYDNSASSDQFSSGEDMAGYLISIANNARGVTASTTNIVVTTQIKLADDFSAASITLGLRNSKFNSVDYDTKDYDSQETDTVRNGGIACTPLVITVVAPSDDTGMTELKVGSGSASTPIGTVSEAMKWENPSATLNNFRIKPTLSDPNATYQVSVTNGTATQGTFPADNKTGANKNGAEASVNLTQGNNTTGIAKVFIRVVAADKTATKVYCLTVTSKYAALADSTTIKTQRPGGAVTVPKDGLEGGKVSATKPNYNVFVPSDVTDASGVQFVPKIPGGYGISEDIEVVATQCSAATSVKNGATLLVTNIENNATLKLTVTAASGEKVDFTFTFKIVNIDTSIKTFTMTGKEDSQTYNSDSTKASADFYFALPSGSGFQGTFNIETTQPTSTVAVGGKAYNKADLRIAGNYTVVVTAEAGNTQTYSVTVENKFDAAKFEKLSLSVVGGDYENILEGSYEGSWEGVGTSNEIYTREVPVSSNTDFKIKGTTTVGAGISVGSGLSAPSEGQEQVLTGKLKHGKNEFRVSLSTDEGTKNYTFVINVLEKKNTITDIKLTSGGKAVSGFTFDADTKEYNLTVPYSMQNALVTVTTDGTYTRVYAENGDPFKSDAAKRQHTSTFTFALPNPDATMNIMKFHAVSDMNLADLSEAGDWYVITVTRAAADDDATLKNLVITINGKEIPIALEQNKFTYTIDLIKEGIDMTSMKGAISATTTADTSTVSGVGSITFNFDGEIATNTFPITVTAEDGVTTKTYVVAVSRNSVSYNKDFTVSKVTVLGNDAVEYYNNSPAVGNTVEISVPYSVTRVNVTAVPGYAGATVFGNGTVELASEAGVAKEVKIYAVAESGDNSDGASAYIFKITRQEQRKSGLANITVNGIQIVGFDPAKTIYTHSVVSSTEKIELRAIAENGEATVKINVGVELAKGKGEATGPYTFTATKGERDSQTFTISVEIDNESRIYTVTVVRASQSPQLKFLRIGAYALYSKDGNIIGESDADALNKDKTFYINLNAGDFKLDITAIADDDLAIVKIDVDPEKYVGTLFYENFDLEAKLQNSPTTEVPLLVMASGGEGQFTSYKIVFTVLTSDTSATINIFKGQNGTNPLEAFNGDYIADPGAPVYGPYLLEQASLNFQINLTDVGGAKGTYEVRRRNNNSEDLLMIDNGEEVDGGIRLSYGTNIFCIKITSSDKKAQRTVVVVIERGGVGAKEIRVNGSTDFKFDTSATSFICSVGNTVTTLRDQISVTLNHDDLEYKLVGLDDELPEGGFAQIKVEIYAKSAGASATADEAPLKTIYINVFRQGAVATIVEPTETPLWQVILFWALVALVVLELIIIIAIPKRKKGAQQVVVAAPMAYAPVPPMQPVQPVQAAQPVQPVQPVQPQMPQAPAAPPPVAPQAPLPPRPAEPSHAASPKPFVSPDSGGYYGNNNGSYGNGGYGDGYGNGSYGSENDENY